MSRGATGLLALACVACGQAENRQAAPVPAAQAASRPPDRAPRPAARDATSRLFLADSGLELVDHRTGAVRQIPFGTQERDVRALIEPVIGEYESRWLGFRCHGREGYRLDYWAGLGLTFAGGRFVAWEQQSGSNGYRTRRGLSNDMTRAALLALGNVEITPQRNVTPPGEDFTMGAIQGVLDGEGVLGFHAQSDPCDR